MNFQKYYIKTARKAFPPQLSNTGEDGEIGEWADIQRVIKANPISLHREVSRKVPKNICIYSSVYVGWGFGEFLSFS